MFKFFQKMLLVAALCVPWATQAQGDCTPISTFPVTYGFEASEGFTTTVTAATACTTNVFSSCWRNEETAFNGSSSTGSGRIWHIYGGTSATFLHSGAHSLMLPDKGSSTAGVSTTMLTFPAMNFTNPGGYIVTFWIQRNGTGTTNPEGFKIYASPTDTIGPGAVELGHYSRHCTMAYPCIEPTTGWYQYETAPITLTGTVYIIFEGQSYYGSSTYIDDVVIMETPTCIKVRNLAIDAQQTTTNSLTLTWTDTSNTGATYNIYRFTATDTTLVQDGVTGTSYTVSGLNPATSYTFAVVTDCGNGDTSMYSATVSALTSCADIAAADLPYTEDFEDYTSGSTNPINPCWTKGTNNTTAYPYPNSAAAINSSIGLHFYGYYPSSATSTHYYSWAALPPIDANLDMSDLMLTLDVKRYSTVSNYYTTILWVGVADSVTGLSSAAAIESSITWIDTIDLTSATASSIHNLEVSFADYAGNGKYVFLYAPTPELVGTSTYRYNHVYVDNVALRVIPTCFWPSDAVVTSVSTDEATISWTPDPRTANPSSWSIEYGETGFTPGEGSTETSYTNSVTLGNLTANTEYDVYIKANCGGEMSDATLFSFRTLCNALDSLPYTMDFEGYPTTTSTSTDFVPCLTRLNNGTQYFGYPYLASTASYCHSGTRGLYWTNSTTTGTYGDYQYVIMPAVDTDQYNMNTLQFKFWARATGTSYHPVFQVGVMSNPQDVNSFQLVESVDVEGTTYEEYTVALGNFEGYGNYIALRALRPSSTWYATVDDLTIEEMPNCPNVVDLEATATVGNALLTWGYQEGYDEPAGYEVTFDSIGGSNPTTLTITDPTALLTGLMPRTNYKAYVRAECGGDYGAQDSIEFSTGAFDCVELDSQNSGIDTVGPLGTTTTYYVPIGQFYRYSYTQQLVLASELNGAMTITGIDFEYAYATATTQKNNVTIYMANTAESSLASAFVPYSSAFVPVYSGPLNGTQGWNHYEFTTPFNYDGNSNLLIIVHDNSNAYPGSAYVYNAHSATGKARYVQNDSSPYDINTVSGGTSYANRANMKLHYGECMTMAVCAAPAATVTDVTATTADISWIPGYDETSWDISYRAADSTNWIVAATGVTANSYQFDNLTPGTDYIFRVSFECSDNNIFESVVSARTVCSFVSIPYSYGFEDLPTGSTTTRPDIPCWHHINNATQYFGYPYPSSTTPHSGTRSLYWYGSTTTGTYADYEVVVLPAVDTNTNPIRTLQLSFWAKPTSTSYAPVVYVGVMTDPEDISTFEYVDTVNIISGSTDWALYESFLNTYSGEGSYVALRANRPSSAWYIYTDDFTLDVIPSCPHVVNLAVDSVSQNSVSLSWTAAGAESTWSVTDGTNYYTTTVPSITIGNLTANTAYTFSVRALCDDGDSSMLWSINARTSCEPILALPYSENFDSYTSSTTAATGVPIPCWNSLMTGTASYQTGSYLPMIYYSTSYPHSGTYCLRLNGVGYHTLPQLPCPADSVTISFWATSTSSSYKCFLGVMSNPNDGTTFDTIQELTFPTYSTPQHFEVNLTNYTGTGRYIAFRNAYTTASTYYSYIYLDDIDVWHNTNCGSPVVNLGNVTNNTIDVTWLDTTVNGYANGVTVMWNTANTTSGAQTASVAAGSSYTINGLNGNTTYYIWIAGNCGNELSRPVPLVATTASDCGIVENLTLAGVSDNTLGISWNAPSIGDPATSYIVTLKKCTNIPFANDFVVVRDTVNATYYMFNGLEDATTYAYSVTTVCNDEVGEANSGYATTTICEMDTVGDYATNYSAQPIYASQAYSYTQQLYMSNELAGIDSINSIAIYQRGLWGEYEDRNVTVYLGYTNKTEFESTADYVPMSNLTQVYSGRLSGFGWISLKFDTTYVRVADSNLVVVIDDNTGVAHTGNCYWACSKFDNPAIYRAMRMYSSSNIQPTSPSGTYARDYYRAFIVFGNAGCENDGCDVPVVMQSAAYADHVDITWNAAQGASYDVSYRILGADNWTTVATGNTSGSATINGLGASFLGEARVSYSCNGQIVSGTTQIQTLCGPASLPLTEDFQSWDYGHFNRPCWISNLTDPTNADREYPYITALTGNENNMLCFMRYGAYVILPQIDTALSECQIRFKLTQGNDDAQILLGVINDASMPIHTMYVLDTLSRIDYDTTSSTASITYSLANVPAAYSHGRIAFWDAMSSYSFIDDIVVELIPSCTPASEITATASTNTATVSWTVNGDNASSYFIVYGPRGFTAGQGDTITATGSPVTITGLNHSTNYDAYVYTVCDLINATSSASNVVQFTTDCAPYTTLPYTENFENLLPAGSSIATVLPNCWASETGSNAVAHVVYTTNSTQASSPQHAFYMNENGVVALPEMGVALNTLKLSFHECNMNPQTNGLIVGTVDNVNTGFAQTFVPYDTIVFTGNQSIYDVTTYMVDYTGTDTRLALKNYSTNGGSTSEHYIDDLTIELAPACIPIQNLRATYLVGDEITLEWMRSNSMAYSVEYGAHGFTLGNGTQTTTTTRNVSLTGLTPQTQYDVYVMSDCDTVFYTFTTPCAAVSLPYTENFDSYTTSTTAATGYQINCWDYIMTGTSTYQTATYQPQIYYGSTNANSGSYSLRLYGESYTMLPPMPTTLDSLQLTFWDYTTSASYGLEVGVMEGNTFIPIQTINSPTSTHVEYEISLSSYHGNSRIIAFRNKYTTSSTIYYSYHYIDDIEVDYIPSCPKVRDLTTTAISQNSVTLGWTNGGSETQWVVEYGNNSDVANSNPYTVTGLTPNTEYTFYVRPLCGVGDTGRARTITVTTLCNAVSLPFTENFDSYTTSTTAATGVLPNCWSYVMTGTNTTGSYLPQIYYSSTYANSGSYSLRLYGLCYFILPEMDAPIDSLQISFNTYKTSAAYELEVGVMEGNTFVPIQAIDYGASTHSQQTVYLASYTGTGNRIAFRNNHSSYQYSYHYIDDIVVDYVPSCMPVHDIHSTGATISSIDVDWTDLSSATEWEVVYGTAGFNMSQGTSMTVYSHPITLSNLDSATNYDVYVRPICSVGDTGSWTMETLMSGICDGMVEFFTGSSTGTSNAIPVDNYYNYSLSQTIIDSAELAQLNGGNGSPINFTGIAYHYNYTTASADKTDVDIWIQPTTKSTFSSTTDAVALNTATAVKVYHGALNCSQGWNYFMFPDTASYNWDGHSNLLVIVDDNSGEYDGSSYVFSTTACTGNKTLVYYSDSDNPNVNTPSTFSGNKYIYSYRPTMKLISCGNAICSKPQVLPASNVTYNSATINWNSNSATSFEVAVKAATDAVWPAEVAVNNASSYDVTNLTPATMYQFRVRAICDPTENLISDWAIGTFTTDSLPCFIPTNLHTTNVGYTSVNLAWSASSEQNHWTLTVWNTAGSTDYDVTGNAAFTVTGLTQENQYYAAVKAVCGNGAAESEYSDTIQFTTNNCEQVAGVTVTNITDNSAVVSWQAATATSYEVDYGPVGHGQGQGTTVTVDGVTTYTITGLESEMGYSVYVRALCEADAPGPWSQVQEFTTQHIGIDVADGMNVSIYPNPTSSTTTIALSGVNGDVAITVVDMNGRVVMSDSMSCEGDCVKTMEVSGLAQGAYFVRINGENVNMVKKLVVK